jgi:predicted O-methyltransferase YrrM
MKLHESQVLGNLDYFRVAPNPTGLMRGHVDMFLLWKTIEYFCPKNLLEIGFYAGQSMGIMLESAGQDAEITAVDITFHRKHIFEKLFSNNHIKFIEIDSRQLELDPVNKYDFISIDGEHDYEYVLNDLNKCFPCMHENTILHMDDYKQPGVERVIREKLLGRHDFVPFMVGDQGMFFHHIAQSADDFLDRWIQDKSKNFIHFENKEIFGFLLLQVNMPHIFVEHPDIFLQSLEFYKL